MTNPKALYLATIYDIEKKLGSSDWFDGLLLALHLRKLLFDGQPLIDAANRQIGERLKFRIPVLPPFPKSLLQHATRFINDDLDPDHAPSHFDRQFISKDRFLNTAVIWNKGKAITVHHVIDYMANVAGGVHLRDPSTDGEKFLASSNWLLFGGTAVIHRQLCVIARVVVKSLAPLTTAIERENLRNDHFTVKETDHSVQFTGNKAPLVQVLDGLGNPAFYYVEGHWPLPEFLSGVQSFGDINKVRFFGELYKDASRQANALEGMHMYLEQIPIKDGKIAFSIRLDPVEGIDPVTVVSA